MTIRSPSMNAPAEIDCGTPAARSIPTQTDQLFDHERPREVRPHPYSGSRAVVRRHAQLEAARPEHAEQSIGH